MESLREGLKQLEQGDHGILHVLLGVSAHAVKLASLSGDGRNTQNHHPEEWTRQ